MKANETSIGDLFQRDVRFVAPLYQRPYVWTHDKNWVPPLKIVSEILGHSQISITADTYMHVTPGMQREAAAAVDAALGS